MQNTIPGKNCTTTTGKEHRRAMERWRLKVVLRSMESEPCACPLLPEPDTKHKTWNELCAAIEATGGRQRSKGREPDLLRKTAQPEQGQPAKKRECLREDPRPKQELQVSPEMRLLGMLRGTRACFCAVCHDHGAGFDEWSNLLWKHDPDGMRGPPSPKPVSIPLPANAGPAEAHRLRLLLYEARAEAGRALFAKDVFVLKGESVAVAERKTASLAALKASSRLAAFCAALLAGESERRAA